MATSLIARAESGNREREKYDRSNRLSRYRGPKVRTTLTLQECSEVFGVTRERIRQIEKKAIRKLWRGLEQDPVLRKLAAAYGLIENPPVDCVAPAAPVDSFTAEVQRRADKMGVTITRDKPKAVRQPKPQPPVVRVAKPPRQRRLGRSRVFKPTLPPPAPPADKASRDEWARWAFSFLPPHCRDIATLMHFEGLTLRQVLVRLDLLPGTARGRLAYCLRRLRRLTEFSTRHPEILEAMENAGSVTDPVIQSLVEAKVGIAKGLELPQLLTVSSSPAAEPSSDDSWRPIPGIIVLSERRPVTRPLTERLAELFPDEAEPETVTGCQPSVNESSTAESVSPCGGEQADPPSWAAMEATAKSQSWVDTLTRKERAVLDLVLTGAISRRIAAQLDCSLRTVEGHRTSIFRKAGVTHFAALVIASVKAGIVA